MPSTLLDVSTVELAGPSTECSVCGRPLRDPDSVRRRKGPKCFARHAGTIPARVLFEHDPNAARLPLDGPDTAN